MVLDSKRAYCMHSLYSILSFSYVIFLNNNKYVRHFDLCIKIWEEICRKTMISFIGCSFVMKSHVKFYKYFQYHNRTACLWPIPELIFVALILVNVEVHVNAGVCRPNWIVKNQPIVERRTIVNVLTLFYDRFLCLPLFSFVDGQDTFELPICAVIFTNIQKFILFVWTD